MSKFEDLNGSEKVAAFVILAPIVLGIFFGFYALLGLMIGVAWNWAAGVCHLPPITFWPAFAIAVLVTFLLGGLKRRSS